MLETGIIAGSNLAPFETAFEQARLLLETEGVVGIGAALTLVEAAPIETPGLTKILARSVSLLLDAFRSDPLAPEAYRAIAGIPASLASHMFDLTLEGVFGSGERDVRAINQIGLLTLVGLLSSAGAHEQAALLLAQVREHRSGNPALTKAGWIARCRWAGCSAAFADHLEPAALDFADADAAQARVDTAPLDLAGHRTRIRLALDADDMETAVAFAGAALSLPVGDSDKMVLVPELALLVAVHAASGDLAGIEADRLRWAFGVSPGIATAAAQAIERRMGEAGLPFLDTAEAERAATLLRSFVAPAKAPVITGYPMRDGKPHVDIVWLEITNHCNQKCTFCPDMFREDARTWLPLEQVKNLIDQLADTISVGSMQLNAYGEPLLHPNIAEILAYIRERKLPFPTFFTSHGMTLVDKKLQQLSGNHPAGIAISLHNDSQQSYEATRSHKIGDYDTLVARVSALMRQMAFERAPSHLRLYQMVSNGAEDQRVDALTRSAFPDTAARMAKHVRKWEAIAAEIAASAPPEARVRAVTNSDDAIHRAFTEASHGDRNHLPILIWVDADGMEQHAFMSARPVGTYANLLLEYDPRWAVERRLVTDKSCGFTATPSLAIFATGRLGICCLDLNSTATFGSLDDFDTLHDALTSPDALRLFAQLANGVAASRGCQICLGGTERHCDSKRLPRPTRPAGHFREGV